MIMRNTLKALIRQYGAKLMGYYLYLYSEIDDENLQIRISAKQLARSLQITIITATKALKELEECGLIKTITPARGSKAALYQIKEYPELNVLASHDSSNDVTSEADFMSPVEESTTPESIASEKSVSDYNISSIQEEVKMNDADLDDLLDGIM